MRVVILGAGFGGLELTTRCRRRSATTSTDAHRQDRGVRLRLLEAGRDVRRGDAGRRPPAVPRRREAGRAVRAGRRSRSIDPEAKRVGPTPARTRPTCSSWRSAPTWTRRPRPAWSRAATSTTRWQAPSACATCCRRSAAGRVIVGVCGDTFKCPPAPSEAALLLHEYLRERGHPRPPTISLVMPFGGADPAVAGRCRRRSWRRSRSAASVRAGHAGRGARPGAQGGDARRRQRAALRPLPRRPGHRVPDVVAASGMAVDGWIPVDPRTLETASPACTRWATSPASAPRRPACSPRARRAWWPTRSSPTARRRAATARYDGQGLLLHRVRRRRGRARRGRLPLDAAAPRRPSTARRRSRPPRRRPSTRARAAPGGSGRRRRDYEYKPNVPPCGSANIPISVPSPTSIAGITIVPPSPAARSRNSETSSTFA